MKIPGVYLIKSEFVTDPLTPGGKGDGWNLQFIVRTADLLAKLPRMDKINGGSVAYVIQTKQTKVLTEDGWTEDL